MNRTHKFPIGTQYRTRNKRKDLCTVIDQLTTTNAKGETVSIRYVATHELCGQTVTNHDVAEASIAMGGVK